jgi:hypothetical protein
MLKLKMIKLQVFLAVDPIHLFVCHLFFITFAPFFRLKKAVIPISLLIIQELPMLF